MADNSDPNREPESRTPAVLGLLVVGLLVVVAYFLVTALHRKGELEDCLMSGRSNCAPIVDPAHGPERPK